MTRRINFIKSLIFVARTSLFISVVVCWLPFRLLSQEFSFQNLADGDGLISNTVYAMHCDSQGYIWFGTDNGVQRFDGREFVNYFESKDFDRNEVFEIFDDYSGRMWFSALGSRYFYLNGDSVVPFEHNALLEKYAGHFKEIKGFLPQDTGGYLVSMPRSGKLRVQSNGYHYLEKISAPKLLFDKKNLLFFDDSSWTYTKSGFGEMEIEGITNQKINLEIEPVSDKFSAVATVDTAYCAFWNKLVKVYTDSVQISEFDKRIIDIYLDSQKRIWLSFVNGGVVCLSDSRIQKGLAFLEGKSVSKIIQDSEGGFWFSTLKDGVFYVPNLTIRNFVSSNNRADRVVSLDRMGERLIACFEDGKLYAVGDSLSLWQDLYKGKTIFYAVGDVLINSTGHAIAKDGHQILSTMQGLEFDLQSKFPHRFSSTRYDTVGWTPNSLFSLSENFMQKELILSGPEDLSEVFQFEIGLFQSALAVADSTYFVCTSKGVFQIQGENVTRLKIELPFLNVRNMILSKSDVLFAVDGLGIVGYDHRSEETKLIMRADGDQSINHVYNDGDSLIWASTDNGLICYDMELARKRCRISKQEGLISNRVIEVIGDEESLVVATIAGVSILDRLAIPEPTYAKVTSLDVLINGQYSNTTSQIEYTEGEALASVMVSSVGFRSSNHDFRYRIKGWTDQWIPTSERRISLPALSAGNYQFELQSQIKGGAWQTYNSIPLKVNKHWSKSLLFILGVLIFLMLLSGLIMLLVFNRKRHKRILQLRLAHYQQQTMQSRMNPHFIFNSLNSLNYFISINKNEMAESYLTAFSRIMRMNVDYGKTDLIELKDELNLIEDYCRLEAMRLDSTFEYKIECEPSLRESTLQIPTMVIQPIVENAIWHGLMKRPSTRVLRIAVHRRGNATLVTVEDNGIGFDPALLQKDSDKESETHALHLVMRRLSLLGKIYGQEFSVMFNRLSEEDEYPGTVCILNFPNLSNLRLQHE